MQVRRACSFLLVAVASGTCLASTFGLSSARPASSTLAGRENQIWAAPLRDSKFAAMMRASAPEQGAVNVEKH